MRVTARAAILLLLLPGITTRTTTAQSDAAFPKDVYAARRARLVAQAPDGVIVVPGRYLVRAEGLFRQDPAFWYLTGVESPYAILVIAPLQRRTALFLPGRAQFAGAQFPMLDREFRDAVWNRPVRRLSPGTFASEATGVDVTYPIDQFAGQIATLAEGAANVYMPLDHEDLYAPPGLPPPLSVAQQFARALQLTLAPRRIVDIAPVIDRMRLVKDEHETGALREAARISGEGLVALMRALKPGMNDREAAGLMEYVWKQKGSPRAAFAPIVASGPNSMTFFTLMGENYNAVDRVMQAGDLLFADYGAAEYQTYTADICRTLPVSGHFTPEQRKFYEIVLEAQEAGIAQIRPGRMMLDAIKASAQVFRKHGLEQFEDVAAMGADHVWGIMPSPTHYLARDAGIVRYSPLGAGVRDLGHHIGLEVQDSRDYSRPLEAGMVITVEPKIYIPDRGIAIMIEDMILVTPNGHENLSASTPKTVGDIEKIMSRRR